MTDSQRIRHRTFFSFSTNFSLCIFGLRHRFENNNCMQRSIISTYMTFHRFTFKILYAMQNFQDFPTKSIDLFVSFLLVEAARYNTCNCLEIHQKLELWYVSYMPENNYFLACLLTDKYERSERNCTVHPIRICDLRHGRKRQALILGIALRQFFLTHCNFGGTVQEYCLSVL